MKKMGFTLAEVLITLVIIGVISALTVPTLMNSTSGQEYRAALKKAISAATQALSLEYAASGNTARDYTNATNFVSGVLATRLQKDQFTYDTSHTKGDIKFPKGCTNDTSYWDNKNNVPKNVFVTADGIMYCVDKNNYKVENEDSTDKLCNSYNTKPCAKDNNPNLWIDVNGMKSPNTITVDFKAPKDIYQAHIYAQKVIPYGDPTQKVFYDAKK